MRRRVTLGESKRVARRDRPDRAQQLDGLGVLHQEAAGTGPQRLEHVLVELERREDHDPHRVERGVVADGPGGGEAVRRPACGCP